LDRELSLAIAQAVCNHSYAGTREEVILVSKAPPKSSGKSRKTGSAGNGSPRRAELADFLRKRRAELQPEDVGLPNGGRRRTPGLRREEVAQLAGVGTTWYTWLEQGRDVRASLSVLEALSGALDLSPVERSHLIVLGRGEDVAVPAAPEDEISPTVRRLVEHIETGPAYILGRRWDYLAWNAAYSAVFSDPAGMPEGRRNHVWTVFTDPEFPKLATDWEQGARSLLARFRADSARNIGDPQFEELIEALREASPEFRRWWGRHEVARSGIRRKFVRHPKVGRMAFEHAIFKLEDAPEQRLILYSALPLEDTPEKLRKLLQS
jgi:transcriptional regulator with XRE-family HTH domain